MLGCCKISDYKIKKILKFFVEDYTSTDASKLMKLNRKTIDRYYRIFRKMFKLLVIDIISKKPVNENYVGYIKGKYGPKCYLNVYKLDSRFFLITKLVGNPEHENKLLHDLEFEEFRTYVNNRLSKFYGLEEKNYYGQIIESCFKYAHSHEALFNLLWKKLNNLTKLSDKNILQYIK